ncbi:MAG: glutamine synthetase [Solirubrobacteraceae bacterium]|nr:glutamine synthetase [Solirubrobacteraceae bacterium]
MNVDGSVEARCDFVLRSVEDRGVRFVRLWFVDVLGGLKSMAIPVSELESALEDGVGVDGSSLEGSARLAERDVIAHPDPLTFQILPWRPGSLVARMFCEVRTPDGRPFAADSRLALAHVVRQAAELGFTFEVGSEIEFFLYAGEPSARGAEDPPLVPLDDGAYFDLTALDVGSDFRRRTIEYLEQMGIPVKSAHHEVAPSQHELDLQHTDALSMADALMTFRLAVKEAARTVGCYATFMPQPVEGQPGSGMHLHLSLADADGNAFAGAGPAEPLSPLGRSFLAGVLAHGREMCAVTNQWVNSYKRLANGYEAPQHVSWTRHGSSALVRVPAHRGDRPRAARIELRSPDPAANPYLVFALVLAAGLRGIERGYELEAETVDEAARDCTRLPQDLSEATDLFEASELARDTLGDRLCDWYVLNKRREWAEYATTVSPFERRRYLRL